MHRRGVLGALVALCAVGNSAAQQVEDPEVSLGQLLPHFSPESGARVLVDEGHRNFHTLSGRYRPFGRLAQAAGYRVGPSTGAFTAEALAEADILVIANARAPGGETSAFTAPEEEALVEWVARGGGLFLVVDHMPFPAASASLAARLGFTLDNAFARTRKGEGEIRFTARNGRLGSHPVTNGQCGDAVQEVRTFAGSAALPPNNAASLLSLERDDRIFFPTTAWEIDSRTPSVSGDGRTQLALADWGKGRVAVALEAAAFTAQLAGKDRRRVGFNAEGASGNKALTLNLLRWLSRQPGC